jgi:hypothetical protein
MANVKITELPSATSLSNADVFPVVQSGVTKKSSVTLPFQLLSFDNIAALKASSAPADGVVVNLLGFYNPGDGGAGQFEFVAASTATEIAGMIVARTGVATGRYIRRMEGDPTWVNVLWTGAKGDGVTDDYQSILAAQTWIESTAAAGTIYFSARLAPYFTSQGFTFSTYPICVTGPNLYKNVGIHCGPNDITIFTLNVQGCVLQNLTIYGKGISTLQTPDPVFGATKPAVRLGPSGGNSVLHFLEVYGGNYALQVEGPDTKSYRSAFGYSYGSASVYFKTGGSGWWNRSVTDQLWGINNTVPAASYVINNWASATAYSVGATVYTQNYMIQCTKAGTSGASAPALKNYEITITDGTAEWCLVAPQTYYGMQFDTGTNEVYVAHQDMTGPFTSAVALTNTLSGQVPRNIKFTDGIMSQCRDNAFDLQAGAEVQITGCYIDASISPTANGVYSRAAYSGNLRITNNRFFGGAQTVQCNISGGTNTIISDNTFDLNTNVSGAVFVNADINSFVIQANTFASGTTTAVTVNAGTSDYYQIANNVLNGAAIVDAGTGANKTTQISDKNTMLVVQTLTAANIANIANAINTANKYIGKTVYDTTNNRLMVASGTAAASPWYVADGSASVTPS